MKRGTVTFNNDSNGPSDNCRQLLSQMGGPAAWMRELSGFEQNGLEEEPNLSLIDGLEKTSLARAYLLLINEPVCACAPCKDSIDRK